MCGLSGVLNAEGTSLAQVEVIGTREDALQHIPGSGTVITNAYLKRSHPLSGNEALRSVSGVHVVDEDGLGLRPNISIRGVDMDRSRKVLVLEDGVPVSLAPYGENSLYYSPPIDRMSHIEVLKGSGSILYGPQTIGGVVNYITLAPPLNPRIAVQQEMGSNKYEKTIVNFGGTYGKLAIDLGYLHKEGAGPRDPMRFSIDDVILRGQYQIDDISSLSFKINGYEEEGQLTYVGLTQNMFDSDPDQNPAIHDYLYVERRSLVLAYERILSDKVVLNTTFYSHYAKRDWWRQDFDRTDTDNDLLDAQGDPYERVSGDATIAGGAIFWETSNGGRNREYWVYSFEPRLTLQHNWLGFENEMKTGLKLHYEKEDNKRINNAINFEARSGVIDDDEDRSTGAVAVYLQNRIYLNDRLIVTPGLRVEHYKQRRHIEIRNKVDQDIKGSTSPTEWIPGLGVRYDLTDRVNMFAGVHRGFSPARFSDAIDSSAEDQRLDAERSWNYELGTRMQPLNWLKTDVTLFYYDYQNKVTAASASSGVTSVNAGATVHKGVEVDLRVDWDKLWKLNYSFYSKIAYSFIDSEQKSGATEGKDLNYAPNQLLNFQVGVEAKNGWGAYVEAVFVDKMFDDLNNTVEVLSADGSLGLIPSHTVWKL